MASAQHFLLAVSSQDEIEALRQFLQPQKSPGSEHGLDVAVLNRETPVLPSCEVARTRNSSQSILEDLLLYLSVRKFGATAASAGGQVVLDVDQQTLTHWEQLDVQQSTELGDSIDIIHGLLLKSKWDPATLSTLSRVVKRLQDPRARQRLLTFAFQILQVSLRHKPKLSGQLSEQDDKLFDEAVHLLLLGVTDLWSAIRKDCARTAAAIAFDFLSQKHIEQYMDSLLCIAIGSRSVSVDKSQVTAWTEREGALLALSITLCSIKTEYSVDKLASEGESKVSQVKDDIKGVLGAPRKPALRYRLGSNQRHTLTQLPRCLVQTLKPTMYQCLRHDQLSVRQLAAQCLVGYGSLCEEPTRLLNFQEVISKLNRINRGGNIEIDSVINAEEADLLDSFEAEGLLDVLARMVPSLPSSFLLKHWKFVFPTLEKYVMHIASSVRQKSSAVVLALAKQYSKSDKHRASDVEVSNTLLVAGEASLKLIIQMLLSLSKQRNDESVICWQQKEGRLLSIDTLVNVLGESLLLCRCEACKVLKWKPEPSQLHNRRSCSLVDMQSFFWVHDQAQSVTWVLGTNEAEGQPGILMENTYDNLVHLSLVHAIGEWIEKNGEQSGLPGSCDEFWQQVLSGCITQMKEGFESTQFELRRISRQVLPGLMMLVIWTDQLEFLVSTHLGIPSAESSWPWECMKYIMLHLRYQQEGTVALSERLESAFSQRLAANWNFAWSGLTALDSIAKNCTTGVDTIVAQVEAKLIAFLSCETCAGSPRFITRLLDGALRSVHMQLPETMQLQTLTEAPNTPASNTSSLDRHFSIFMVPIFPAVVSVLQYLVTHVENVTSTTTNMDQPHEDDLSWSSRWLCLERITLAWLMCDDMLRWITLSRIEAQLLLVESLCGILRFSKTDLSPSDEVDEVDRTLQCLTVFPTAQAMKEAVFSSLVEIYLRMWLRLIKIGKRDTAKVAIATTQLYSRRQQYLAIPDTKTKPVESSSTCPDAESWDDWDDDEYEIQQASPVGEMQEPRGALVLDTSFHEVLGFFDATQLTMLREAARAIPNLAGAKSIPAQHVAGMQQQIEACLR